MRFVRIRITVTVLALASAVAALAASPAAQAASPMIEQLAKWEIQANAALTQADLARMAFAIVKDPENPPLPVDLEKRLLALTGAPTLAELRKAGVDKLKGLPRDLLGELATQEFAPRYYEIPLSVFSVQPLNLINLDLSAPGAEFVTFERDGTRYVRWFVHPMEEHPVVGRIAQELRNIGLDIPEGRAGFRGRLTSSRSILLNSTETGRTISLKVSLLEASGLFKGKRIRPKELRAWTEHSRYLSGAMPRDSRSAAAEILSEPLSIGVQYPVPFGAIDDGFITRVVETPGEKPRYLLPAFAALHEETGRKLALASGSRNPAEFWEEHLLRPLARAQAEVRAYTGAEHTSPHSQNILIELDENMKPTGKIVFRDLDYYVSPHYLKALHSTADPEGLADRALGKRHTFTLRNGLLELPSWLPEERYNQWIHQYFEEFTERYARITGIPKAAMKGTLHRVKGWGLVPVDRAGYVKGGENSIYAMVFEDPEFMEAHEPWLARLAAGHVSPHCESLAPALKKALGNSEGIGKGISAGKP